MPADAPGPRPGMRGAAPRQGRRSRPQKTLLTLWPTALGPITALVLAATPGAGQSLDAPSFDAPQSAIPWLTDSLTRPAPEATPAEPEATPIVSNDIAVQPLGATRRDAVGLRPASAVGLPSTLFAGSDPARLAQLFSMQPPDALPALQAMVQTLLTAEFDPPRAAADPDTLFFARIDTLMRLGAVDPAQALLEQAGTSDPEAFRRWWDAALFTGFDDRACATMVADPTLAPSLPARIFCLTRTGDWAAAALTLETGRALGAITETEDRLLAQFLDPELFEGEPPPIPPRPMTPLGFRLLDGIGETPSTRDLPLAFAIADLRPSTGWKAQIEAAERLVRAGAIASDRLFALYAERRPSASGGVWERAAAIQALEAALLEGDSEAIAPALMTASRELGGTGLLFAFADAYGSRLARLDLPGRAGSEALRLALLSWDYAAVSRDADLATPRGDFALAVARGGPLTPPPDPLAEAIARGLSEPPPADIGALVQSDRAGEALLSAALLLDGAPQTLLRRVSDGLALLVAAGRPETARRAALQMLLGPGARR